MPRSRASLPCCPSPDCRLRGQHRAGNVVLHASFRLKRGRRRRYRCTACGHTFCPTTRTPYDRIQHSKNDFDRVIAMSVEGVSKSSIARIMGISWNTVARWIERAAACARQFNDAMMQGYALRELQADEIRTFTSTKLRPTWLFLAIEVWSRMWLATVVGRRSYKNTELLFREATRHATWTRPPLITTDGFEFYEKVVPRIFRHGCVYSQVLKTWRNNRVSTIEYRTIVGEQWKMDEALAASEDSSTINTSFIERLNLTVRQGSAYLRRKTPCHARSDDHLADHLELQRCHYNFIRPHRALKFDTVKRTPAMQAGIVSKRLSFRDVFLSSASLLLRRLRLSESSKATGALCA